MKTANQKQILFKKDTQMIVTAAKYVHTFRDISEVTKVVNHYEIIYVLR